MAQQDNSTINNIKTRQISLDTLRDNTPTKTEFQQLVLANLPRGQDENVVQTLSCQVTNSSAIQALKELKSEVLAGVKDGTNVTWTDAKPMNATTDENVEFDFDLYFRFVNSPRMENKMKLDELWGEAIKLRPVISDLCETNREGVSFSSTSNLYGKHAIKY